MHTFVHPLGAAVDPVWEARSDWNIFKGFAESFSRQAEDVLGTEKDLVLAPLAHDTPTELGQPFDVAAWWKGECEPIPGKTMPTLNVGERDYPNPSKKFTYPWPLPAQPRNGRNGNGWKHGAG